MKTEPERRGEGGREGSLGKVGLGKEEREKKKLLLLAHTRDTGKETEKMLDGEIRMYPTKCRVRRKERSSGRIF